MCSCPLSNSLKVHFHVRPHWYRALSLASYGPLTAASFTSCSLHNGDSITHPETYSATDRSHAAAVCSRSSKEGHDTSRVCHLAAPATRRRCCQTRSFSGAIRREAESPGFTTASAKARPATAATTATTTTTTTTTTVRTTACCTARAGPCEAAGAC